MEENTTRVQNVEPADTHPEDTGAQTPEGKTFTQEEVNRIVSERLARERTKAGPDPLEEREKALAARESRLDCKQYLSESGYSADLLDILDTGDVEAFKGTIGKLKKAFSEPNGGFIVGAVPPPLPSGTGLGPLPIFDPIHDAFQKGQ